MKPRSFITTFVLLAVLLPCPGCWTDDQQPLNTGRSGDPPGSPAAVTNAEKPAGGIEPITIDGAPALRFSNELFLLTTQNDLVNQYIPSGQTVDDWQAMFVLRRFPELASPENAIDNVIESLQGQNPQWRYVVTKGRRPDVEQIVDFVIWNEDKSLTEFNIHIYRKDPSGQGLISNMYLMRGYGDAGHEDLIVTIAQNRATILDRIIDSRFPIFFDSKNQ